MLGVVRCGVRGDCHSVAVGTGKCGKLGTLGQVPMSDVATALVCEVLKEVLGDASQDEAGARAHVASKVVEAVCNGEKLSEMLRQIGERALSQIPRMWRDKQAGQGRIFRSPF